MTSPTIGVDLADLRLPVKDAIRAASQSGFTTIEFPAGHGETTAESLTLSGRKHLRKFVEDHRLQFASLSADFPGLRLTDPKTMEQRIDRTILVMQMGRDIGVPIITAAVGALTHPETGAPSPLALEALSRLGESADSRGVVYAIRPTYDDADRMFRLLDELRCPALKICVDPAAMVMAGVDPAALIRRIPLEISLFHARDATRGHTEQGGAETNFGDGDVDIPGLMTLLHDVEYHSPYILRRLESQNPLHDLTLARGRLTAWLK